jgi:three-Cys-motif partner protein
MTGRQLQFFGGGWTELKLGMLDKYLAAYAKVMMNQPFERFYIDAFAGTGYREAGRAEPDSGFFAPELAEDEPQDFLDGSARIALRIQPPFHRYVFVEQSARRFTELLKLKEEFPTLADRMKFIQGDSNCVLRDLCGRWNSRKMRGVLFLDPFGMQVDWTTLEAVARTQAIDVWILFPVGIGVNRLLPRDGKVPDAWRTRLNRVFGTTDWYDAFYRPARIKGFFDAEPRMVKTGSFNAIAEYYQERLRTVFPAVAENPRVLTNSRRTPLFLLCFAVGNPSPKAKEAAMRIAQHILGKGRPWA